MPLLCLRCLISIFKKNHFGIAIVLFTLVSCEKVEYKVQSTSSYDQETFKVLSKNCFECHAYGRSEGGLGNMESSSFMVSSGYVNPNAPELSVLYTKITSPTFGQRMPLGASALSSSDRKKILTWIESLNNVSDQCVRYDDVGVEYTWSDVKGIFDSNVYLKSDGTGGKTCIQCHGTTSSKWIATSDGTNADFCHFVNDHSSCASNNCASGGDCIPYPGQMVVPFDPCESRLYRRIIHANAPEDFTDAEKVLWNLMPKSRNSVSQEDIKKVFLWIEQGAKP